MGTCLYREGSPEAAARVDRQKDALYAGRVPEIITEMRKALASGGPGGALSFIYMD